MTGIALPPAHPHGLAAPRLLVFDWDGTLVNSIAHIVECLRAAGRACDLEFPGDAAAQQVIGLGLDEALHALFGNIGATRQTSLKQAYVDNFARRAASAGDFYPGAREALSELREMGLRLAVATGKSRRGLDRALIQLGLAGFFDATRCADETASKPDPAMLHELLRELECRPEEALLVGDTSWDLEMARSARMPAVAVSYGAHSASTLTSLEPLAIVDDLRTLVASLRAARDMGRDWTWWQKP